MITTNSKCKIIIAIILLLASSCATKKQHTKLTQQQHEITFTTTQQTDTLAITKQTKETKQQQKQTFIASTTQETTLFYDTIGRIKQKTIKLTTITLKQQQQNNDTITTNYKLTDIKTLQNNQKREKHTKNDLSTAKTTHKPHTKTIILTIIIAIAVSLTATNGSQIIKAIKNILKLFR